MNTNNSHVLHGLEAVVDEAVDLDAQPIEISERSSPERIC